MRGVKGTSTPHGSPWTYRNHDCRCDACKRGWADYMADLNHRMGRHRPLSEWLAELSARPVPHGTETGYGEKHRCRCEACRMAANEGRRKRRQANAESRNADNEARRRRRAAA